MPKVRKTSAKKRRRQNKKYQVNKKNKVSVTDHKKHSCDAAESIVLCEAPECNDGSVYDHTVQSCDATESIILSDAPEHNDGSVYDHNIALCDVTQFKLTCISEDETSVRNRHLKEKRERSMVSYYKNHDRNLLRAKAYHRKHQEERLHNFRKHYSSNRQERLEGFKKHYASNRQERLEAFKKHYASNHQERLEAFKKQHASHHQERLKQLKDYYASHNQQIKDNAREHYAAVAETKNAKLRQKYRLSRLHTKTVTPKNRAKLIKKMKKRRQRNSAYYTKNATQLKKSRRARYALNLSEPKQDMKQKYIALIRDKLAKNVGVQKQLKVSFDVNKSLPISVTQSGINLIASRRLVNLILNVRKHFAGLFLGVIKKVNSNTYISNGDFGEQYHVASGEPYFYQACHKKAPSDDKFNNDVNAYNDIILSNLNDFNDILSDENVNDNDVRSDIILKGESNDVDTNKDASEKDGDVDIGSGKSAKKGTVKLACTDNCKPLTDSQIKTIEDLKEAFEEPVNKFRAVLKKIDTGCPNEHDPQKNGHPLACFEDDSECTSKLRILRAASPHYPMLCTFLRNVYQAMNYDNTVSLIDQALSEGDVDALIKIATHSDPNSKKSDVAEIFSSRYESDDDINLRDPDLETKLLKENVNLIAEFQKEISDQNEHVCCSCRRLMRHSNMAKVFDKDKESEVWKELEAFLTNQDPNFDSKQLLMCKHCKPIIRSNRMPARCVLNNLQSEPLPDELKGLDPFSCQLIQLAKCFQTVVRLGTYTAKVPIYNSLKACKGTVFYLPLPLEKTMETLGNARDFRPTNLPNPELYVVLNSKPTKNNKIWRTLVDVKQVQAAYEKLKDINWLYTNLNDESLDEVSKKVVEVANSATSTMVEEATDEDILGFQSYTIQNMNSNLSKGSDVQQYKMQNVKEDPLDNRQVHLDVMCFPTLFPTGRFGEFHPRKVKLNLAEYIKSRILSEDSRYRLCHSYLFYYLKIKQIKELKGGIFKLLNTVKGAPMTAAQFIDQVNMNGEHLEKRLCTMMQTVRGSNQYWYLRRSELKRMIAELGSPTFFLTFSCAEYSSEDIREYLHKVNEVPPSYNTGKLCTEDPVSVSRQFSLKFNEMFNKVLIKGQVLGQVTEYYYKKEYQARGAPHYHALIWIANAPVIGESRAEDVTRFIDERITCSIPDKGTCPELHRLVTKYQLHKCSNYCKKKRKFTKNVFVTKCKFGFPRPVSENTVLRNVEQSMKSEKRIYHLNRSEEEVRVNDYNPLLLLLWKANIDVSFTSECSLALADYVSGYVTKAERGHMQELWQDIFDNKGLYSKLFRIGIKCLDSRSIGLYETCDVLLGEPLCRKSRDVSWVDVDMPNNRTRRVREVEEVREIAKNEPSTEEFYGEGLVTDFYPKRPPQYEEECLYDFVAKYIYNGKDKNGKRCYRKLQKERLPNFKEFNVHKEDQRDSYYYSIILLFVPFRNEDDLVNDGETVKEAFDRHIVDHERCVEANEKFRKLLKATEKLKEIKDARAANREEENEYNEADDDPQLMGQIKDAMKDVKDMDIGSSLTLQERESMLNTDQKRIFDHVKAHLLKQIEYERKSKQEKEQSECVKPLHMFISGVGGTGKSFLIEAIKALVKSLWSTLTKQTCAVAAPTGLAAYNVGGVTAHRLFQLPIEHEGQSASYWSLPKASHKVMKTELQDLKMVIIDEVSMVSSLNLAYIHMRLNDIFESGEYFGGRNVLFVGDILQLPPVNGSPVFEKVTAKTLKYRLGSIGTVNIWCDTVTYDELTINERQKTDQQFSEMLDKVRRGFPDNQTLSTLSERVFSMPIKDKFKMLQDAGNSPVCLFPKRDMCKEFNDEMLANLPSPTKEISATNLIDETVTIRRKGDKLEHKVEQKLTELNKDLNNTGGLEAKLKLAVGARVMLRCNVNVEEGLVNGALGTVQAIAATRITVKFDRIANPCEIEKVKRKFMVMKNVFVYRSQFPLILAFAVTIHKCQGLSLDNAIIDLSHNVFSAGMAYVALSRVRTLSGVHLTCFDPKSLIVSPCSIQEINRLRQLYRPDLPQYAIPKDCGSRKRKLTGNIDEPQAKNQKKILPPKIVRDKRSRPSDSKNDGCSKKPPIVNNSGSNNTQSRLPPCFLDESKSTPLPSTTIRYDPSRTWPFVYNPVGITWQRETCQKLGLRFIAHNGVRHRGPDVQLKCPDIQKCVSIRGDGNCFFRSISHIITGNQQQHQEIRAIVVEYLRTKSHLFVYSLERSQYDPEAPDTLATINSYIERTRMARDRSWASHIEIYAMAHLLKTTIFVFDDQCRCGITSRRRCQCPPVQWIDNRWNVALSLAGVRVQDLSDSPALYLYNPPNHFEVVTDTLD